MPNSTWLIQTKKAGLIQSATAAHQRLIGNGHGHVVVVGDAEQLTGPLEAAGYQVRMLELDV